MKLGIKDYLELMGITAVILSLLFVALEIRQSNRIALSQSETDFRSRVMEMQSRVIENDDIAAALVKLRSEDAQLTPEENEKIYSWTLSLQTNWNSVTAAFANGLVSQSTMNTVLEAPSAVFGKYPGLKSYFRLISEEYNFRQNPTNVWQAIFEEIDSNNSSTNRP